MQMPDADTSLIMPDWVVPDHVHACTSTRQGGVSSPPWDSLNPAMHVGDVPAHVSRNRDCLSHLAALPARPLWLDQVHGNRVINAADWQPGISADGCYSDAPGQVCCILTADCLPLLIASQQGDEIAAVHAGWRGLANGVIAAALAHFRTPARSLAVWLGPAISARHYEVDASVLNCFSASAVAAASSFTRPGHANLDLYTLAREQLSSAGIGNISGGQYCTHADSKRFFSHRRQQPCGRMASLIWLQGS